jgi:uncharacterized protein (DUF924 family)
MADGPLPEHVQGVLDYWFEDGLALGWPSRNLNAFWFGKDTERDRWIEAQFGGLVREALAGGLRDWEAAPRSRLALIILLDQFTRNVFRGTAQAFAGDARTGALVTSGLAQGKDKALPWVGRTFFLMPLMHAEDIALQDEGVARFTELRDAAPPALRDKMADQVESASEHRDIVARFGRFPHRNAALGRTSTAEEEEFLQRGPRFGQ